MYGSTPSACAASAICRGTSNASRRTSIATPLAAATCPTSASNPSDTSIMAVAPSRAACGPAEYGTSGRRYASTSSRGCGSRG